MIYGLLYVLCMSFSSVLVEKAGLKFSPALILVFGSLLALLYFNLINIKQLKQIYQVCWQHKWETLLINFSVFIIWMATVYGIVYAGAAVFIFVFFATIGLSAYLVEYTQQYKKRLLFSIVLIIILLIIMTALHVHPPRASAKLKGILLGILGGAVGYYYLRLSGRLMQKTKMRATQVLAIRFYLTIILGYFLIPADAITDLTINNIGFIFVIICFNLIIPLYFMQKAVGAVGSEFTALLISCTPLMTAVMETLILQKVPRFDFIIYLVYALIVGIPYIKKFREKPSL